MPGTKDTLLFLTHRLPYPPNKGDKIRSYNLLKHLSSQYRVYLGTFIDDPHDLKYLPKLEQMCHEVHAEVIRPKLRKALSARGLLHGKALSLLYYYHPRLAAWVREKLASDTTTRVLIYSSPMAQYVLDDQYKSMRRIADFVDVDSEKWRQYAEHFGWLMRSLHRREADKLLAFEREVAARFDSTVFVSELEANLFRQLAPEVSRKVTHINNGVDVEFFSPARPYDNPYPSGELPVVFTGAMDYRANIDAVKWFAQEIFPQVIVQVPEACFYIVGARPTEEVRRLGKLEGVRVTGTVPDIRPYLSHARFAVAPLRVARGIQNKVLEAMAMAKMVLATPAAVEGLGMPAEFSRLTSDEPTILAARAVDLLTKGDKRGLGQVGRDFAARAYSWDYAWQRFESLFRALDKEQKYTISDSEDSPDVVATIDAGPFISADPEAYFLSMRERTLAA